MCSRPCARITEQQPDDEEARRIMRLVSYAQDGALRAGVLVQETVVDTERAARHAGLPDGDWRSNRFVVAQPESEREGLAAAAGELRADGMPVSELRLGPPVPDPDKILCMGLNYSDHAAEGGMELPEVPLFFAKFRNSLIGPTDDIVLPPGDHTVDYEVELAVVIGRRCRGVDAEAALACIAGAMVLNDVSARDLQMQVSQWTMGKAIDTFAPCGPALVLRDEIEDLQSLSIRTRVNGQTLQDANTSLMVFTATEAVAFLSSVMTLEPGDIVATGTPAGVGQSRTPPVWLRDGDVVECEVEGLGTLRNPVRAA
jgi:2-keto-4-pentenoate hydratase/2-oxohepta-3-ene-1,7-dioic acid hydratase in catechol pathway